MLKGVFLKIFCKHQESIIFSSIIGLGSLSSINHFVYYFLKVFWITYAEGGCRDFLSATTVNLCYQVKLLNRCFGLEFGCGFFTFFEDGCGARSLLYLIYS